MTMINTALSGALAAQAALSVASQNVANVMTPGYTRQGVLLTSAQPSRTGAFAAGDGVDVPKLLRFSDDFKSLQMWNAASSVGQYTASESYFAQLEQVMGDEASTLNSGLDSFFSALNAASVEPSSSPLRQQVIDAADALAQRFNSLSRVLSGQQASVQQQRATTVTQVNGLAVDIAALNKKIAFADAAGTSTSGLIDERDKKTDALAALVGIQVVNHSDGSRSISLPDGQPLVAGTLAGKLEVQSLVSGGQSLSVKFANQTFGVVSGRVGGQLGGLGDFEDRVLMPLATAVSDMAREVATRFNTQLAAGYAMDGTPGAPLFVYNSTGLYGTLQVDPTLTPQALGFSADPAQPDNSDNLLQLIDLKNQPITVGSLGSVLMGDAYTQLVSRLGTDSQQNAASLTVAGTVRTYAVSSWKSTSGVNSDEEAINILQFQQMYQANMKVIAVANQLFDSTLAMMN